MSVSRMAETRETLVLGTPRRTMVSVHETDCYPECITDHAMVTITNQSDARTPKKKTE